MAFVNGKWWVNKILNSYGGERRLIQNPEQTREHYLLLPTNGISPQRYIKKLWYLVVSGSHLVG